MSLESFKTRVTPSSLRLELTSTTVINVGNWRPASDASSFSASVSFSCLFPPPAPHTFSVTDVYTCLSFSLFSISPTPLKHVLYPALGMNLLCLPQFFICTHQTPWVRIKSRHFSMAQDLWDLLSVHLYGKLFLLSPHSQGCAHNGWKCLP